MIEVDRHGAPHLVGETDARTALALLADTITSERQVGRSRLRLVLHLVATSPATPADARRWDRLDAGEEALEADTGPLPLTSVAAAVGTALATTPAGAQSWITDALDIRFRLPRLHTRLEALEVELWKVRTVARLTHQLPAHVAGFVDAALEERIDKIGSVGIQKTIALAVATLLPERLEAHDAGGKSGWHVEVNHPGPVDYAGTSYLDASADSLDLEDFMVAVRQIAAELADAGDDDPLQQRMAKALGVLGRRTTHPLQPDTDAPSADTTEADGHPKNHEKGKSSENSAADGDADAHEGRAGAADDADATAQQPSPSPRKRTARAPKPLQVFVRGTTGTDGTTHLQGEVPRFGIVPQAVLDRWLSAHEARFTSIVDLDRTGAVDQHDPPAWMRDLVQLRDGHCVFPGCTSAAPLCDLDHITPYDPTGPPGQTSPEKLACLCRRHHLLKTHTGWTYRRDGPDQRQARYVWTSPHGHTYIVDASTGTDYLIDQAA